MARKQEPRIASACRGMEITWSAVSYGPPLHSSLRSPKLSKEQTLRIGSHQYMPKSRSWVPWLRHQHPPPPYSPTPRTSR